MTAKNIVVRIWQGKVSAVKAGEYARYHAEAGVKKLESIPGNLGVQVLRRTEKEVTEFTTISFWESREAIRKFAGEQIDKPHHLPKDPEYLLELPTEVRHYELDYDGVDRHLDHIDLRVPSLMAAKPFYGMLLPALGFSNEVSVEKWFTFEGKSRPGTNEFFGITESPRHVPNETRIAFWAGSTAHVDRLAEVVRQASGRRIEGPGYDEGPGYYAVFFEDPCGNRLEICHRESKQERTAI